MSADAAAAASAVDSAHDCGIFWDYESVKLLPEYQADVTVNRLRAACKQFGRLVESRLYHNPAKNEFRQSSAAGGIKCIKGREAIDLSGFTLVDCPTLNSKETLDKKIIVDVMHFAWECMARQQSPCVILISNDGDYAYMLSKLRAVQVLTVVVHTSQPADILLSSCDLCLRWRDVLETPTVQELATRSPRLAPSKPVNKNGRDFIRMIPVRREGPRLLNQRTTVDDQWHASLRSHVRPRPDRAGWR